MAHNFKLTGDYYVSVDGSDSNNGLTKDTPKRTVQAGLNLMTTTGKTLIIGAGVYNETISRVFVTSSTNYIYADGTVVLEGNGLNRLSLTGVAGAFIYIYDVIIRNYDTIFLVNNSVSGSILYFTRCIVLCNIFLSINTGFSGLTPYFINSIYANGSINRNQTNNLFYGYFESSIAINLGLIYVGYFKNSFCDSSTVLSSWSTIATSTFNYNNIRGPVLMNIASTVTSGVYQDVYGRYYDLSITTSTGDGTIGNPYGRPYTNGAAFSFTNHRILYPTWNANSFSADPKFNNIEAQDFTLQITSPHIGKASDGINNIGGTKYALRYEAKGAEFNTSAVSISGLAFVKNDWTISGGTTGEVISAPMLISSTTKVLQKISYKGLLEFNKLITPPATGNRNVPDQEVYDSTSQPPNVAGANPDRLVYYMRYSTQTAQPTTNSEWDNGGYWTAGNYGTFEWNTKPSIDNAFLGNGDPSFNSGVTPTFLNVTWIQLKVKLRNDYA